MIGEFYSDRIWGRGVGSQNIFIPMNDIGTSEGLSGKKMSSLLTSSSQFYY